MAAKASKVSNRTGGILQILIFNDYDHHSFGDLRQPPNDGRKIELDGSEDGAAVKVGVIHNEVGGRFVFDLFRVTKGATLVIKKVTREGGVHDYEARPGIELLSLGRTISMSAGALERSLRGHPVTPAHHDEFSAANNQGVRQIEGN